MFIKFRWLSFLVRRIQLRADSHIGVVEAQFEVADSADESRFYFADSLESFWITIQSQRFTIESWKNSHGSFES